MGAPVLTTTTTSPVGHAEWVRHRCCDRKRNRYTGELPARNAATVLAWKGHPGLHPYKCPYCVWFHLGHDRREDEVTS